MSNRSQFCMPTPYEMEALKIVAHRARARQMKVLLRLGVRAVKSRIAHLALPTGHRVSHA